MRRLRKVLSPSKKINLDLDCGSSSPIKYDNVLSEEWQAQYSLPESVGDVPVSSGREKHDRDNDSLVSQEVDQTVSEPSFSRSASSNMFHGLKYRADSMVDSAQSSSGEMSPRSTAASEECSSVDGAPAQKAVSDVSYGEHSQQHSDSLQSLIDEFKSCCWNFDQREKPGIRSGEISEYIVFPDSRGQLSSLIQKVGELAEIPKTDLKAKAFFKPLDPNGSASLINLNNVAKALQMQEAFPFGRERINAQQQSVIGSFVVLYNAIVHLEAEILNSYQILPQQGKELLKNLKNPVIRFMKGGEFEREDLTLFAEEIKSKMTAIYSAQPTQKVKTLCNRVMAVLANIITVGLINFWKDSKGSCFTSALFKPVRRDFESRPRVLESITAIERSKTLSR